MNFVIDPGLVVVYRVIFDRVPSVISLKSIHNFDLFEVDHDTALSSTRNIVDSIGLHRHLYSVICRNKW